jgi:GT2 family glycosyltransferase
MSLADRVSIVMLTFDRREEVLRSLEKMHESADGAFICVVDNGSIDGTAHAVRSRFPSVNIISLARNIGAAARNMGARCAVNEYVAFCDDDTWWAPAALKRAADFLDAHARVAVVTGRVLVGPAEREDAACVAMAMSPLQNDLGVPGTLVIGFLAGACMVRRSAFLAAGGYHQRLFIGSEERLLATDLACRGWAMAYSPDVVVHHYPSQKRDAASRRRIHIRNSLWCAWLRRPLSRAWRETIAIIRSIWSDPRIALSVCQAAAGLLWVLRERRCVPPDVEEALRRIEAGPDAKGN